MYLSIGDGKHVDEVRFSILSAARFLSEDADWRIALYTDRAALFSGLPVEFRAVDEAKATDWAGPHHYVYRGKILALADALADPATRRAAIVDGDTYFEDSPADLFARLAPGRSVMHVREGRPELTEVGALRHVLARGQPVDLDGHPWGIEEDEILWNSGVVGLDAADSLLCQEAVRLTDQLLEHEFAEHSHIAEMVAFGVCLSRRTNLGECFDIVTHYWPTELREPFLALLRTAWADPSLDQHQHFDRLWPLRPKETAKRRAKFVVKRLAWKVGVNL